MSNLPTKYQWLESLPTAQPWVIKEGLKLYGTLETPGSDNNPTILAWADELGGWEANFYAKDSIPWCGLYAAIVAKRARKEVPKNYLRALSWVTFGDPVDEPGLGDILTFTRQGGGHVGYYIAEDDTHFHVLGGNQSDQVNITRIAKSRLYEARRPKYMNKPKSVKRYFMKAEGEVSTNEA